ncbi:LysR family transcriptional regulator [Rhizobium sp. S-51]|uniref:HTH-type transcriptional regulator TtuA n=1 Tax=Rhizobium terricola TaxID=2728849 RepID=A0A7Y0FU82_9HYPH|nr:LysR family transcriptional regulator [Rhizobium terricola]NML73122.1 LysR family transcriptional regulator [Rhizobium terricola]
MKKSGLVELHAVAAVAAARSFRAAAAELGLSASALSHAVAAIETRMGVKLFNRTTRSVSLTQAGEQFLGKVGPALKEIEAAMEAATQSRATPAGRLRINTSEGAARGLLMPIVLEFLRRYRDVDVDIVSEGRMVDIVAEGFDIGIRLIDTVPQDMIAIPLTEHERFVVVGSPQYIERHGKPLVPADLTRHACLRLRLPSGTIYRWEFERHGEEIRVDVEGPLTLQDMQLMREAAVGGAGLAYMTERNVAADLAAGRLVTVLEEWTPPFPGLCLYYSGHRHLPPALRAFADLARQMSRKT